MELPEDPFRAIADPTRRRILEALQARPLAVHEIAARFEVSRPAISRHLRLLADAGLVTLRRTGKENLYALRAEAFAPVADWLGRFWGGKLGALKALAERRT